MQGLSGLGVFDVFVSNHNFNDTLALPEVSGRAVTIFDNYGSVTKKMAQIAGCVIQIFNYYQESAHLAPVLTGIKVFALNVDIRSSYRNMIYWMYPITSKSLNTNKLKNALAEQINKSSDNIFDTSIGNNYIEMNCSDLFDNNLTAADDLIKETLKQNYANKKQFLEALRSEAVKRFKPQLEFVFQSKVGELVKTDPAVAKLMETSPERSLMPQETKLVSILDSAVSKMINDLSDQIELVPAPRITVVAMGFSTLSGLGNNFASLGKLSLLDLGEASKTLGKIPVLKYFASVTLEASVIGLGSVAYTLNLVDSSTKLYRVAIQLWFTVEQGEARAAMVIEVKQHAWDCTTNGLNLVSAMVPFVVALNPPTMLGLAIFTKGMEVGSFFFKPVKK